MPRNRAKRDAKNSRSAERGCSSVLTPPNRRRMVGARNPAPPRAGYAAQSRKARCKKQPERRARLFLCSHAAEQAANGWSPQPCPTTSRLCRAIAQSAMQKQPERRARLFLCPHAAEQAANGWSPQPCLTPRQAMPRNRAAMHKQLSSPKRSPPPHTPLKHPAMFLLCIHIPQNSCTIFVILLCRGRLIAANSIYLISIVRLPHVGRAATKIPSRLQIKNKPNVK